MRATSLYTRETFLRLAMRATSLYTRETFLRLAMRATSLYTREAILTSPLPYLLLNHATIAWFSGYNKQGQAERLALVYMISLYKISLFSARTYL